MAPRDNPDTAAAQGAERAPGRPDLQDVRRAIRTLIAATGDDPGRLESTPDQVIAALGERFAGYAMDAEALLHAARQPAEGAQDLIMLRDIVLASHCDHHIAPIAGRVHVAYFPGAFLASAEAIAQAVDAIGLRMQSQETMTVQIARAVERALAPRGVGVVIVAQHLCMTTRGVRQIAAATVTSRMTGLCDDPELRRDLLALTRR